MMSRSFDLVGLDGTNPLGFLTALGTLLSLQEAGAGEPELSWKELHRWVPVLQGVAAEDEEHLAFLVADSLRGNAVTEEAEARRVAAQEKVERAKRAVEKRRDEIRKRGLRGSDRTEAEERELQPLRREYEEARGGWLDALRGAVPRPELALGKRLDCSGEEYREHAARLVGARRSSREALDLLASFGTDAVRQRNREAIEPTPFCFITGSGHQDFLDTVRQLVARVSQESVHRTLFRPWDYRDEKLSMRWDPIEDRRYALMDRDPTASDNKPRTMWMANLLGYRALALFPSAATGRGLGVTGWDTQRRSFSWPLWECPLDVDGVRSVVQLRQLLDEHPDVSALWPRGILAVYRAQRIAVGTGPNRKVNFAPARRVA